MKNNIISALRGVFAVLVMFAVLWLDTKSLSIRGSELQSVKTLGCIYIVQLSWEYIGRFAKWLNTK